MFTAPDLAIDYDPTWVRVETADVWQRSLASEVVWRREHIRLFGRRVAIPRQTAWHGEPGCTYTYSGLTMSPRPWTATLQTIRQEVEAACGLPFNGVLLNRYRDGNDSMGWHADDEPELGPSPTIASVTLGTPRTFQLKHRTRKDVPRIDLELAHGSLLVMRPPTQAHWLHAVPKRRRGELGIRINLTFRYLHGSGS